ncbi:ferredoxin [Streptomyces sp. NPDC059881]|uniref:ferredoxin n=1 Tax=Streptomyces sp. NPDC059881 TaxID=3346986 RepID=UPI00365254E5
MGEAPAYWDPLPVVQESTGLTVPVEGSTSPGSTIVLPSAQEYMCGRWVDQNWRNVPGPFYGALTDNCWTGRLIAPAHILYDDEDHSREFVFRQPRTEAEVRRVLRAAVTDPYGGYAFDGDAHWTTETVRTWWGDRGRLLEWISQATTCWTSSDREDEREVVVGLRAYKLYIETDLADHLRGYLFWLDQRRSPLANETLPDVTRRGAKRTTALRRGHIAIRASVPQEKGWRLTR